MQPSSLIFLVIVAIWVAYLVQHWVRRREHLATARSVDKFSEAMRVLERRKPLPEAMQTATSPEHGPTTPSRPEVTVKHPSAASPLRARSRSDSALPPAHDIPPIELVPHRTATQLLVRRLRGVLFLASVVAVPTTLALSAGHILKWISLWISLGTLVVVTVWLRVSAIMDQKARRGRREAHRHLAQARVRVGETSIRGRRTLAEHTPASPKSTGEDTHTVAAEADAPGSWRPVPVPPPTYTLKEPAHPREPRSNPDRPVPIEVEDDDVETMTAAPRQVVGS